MKKYISEIKDELIEIQKLVLCGDYSDTDLANWFIEFCDEIGCGANETYESMRGKSIIYNNSNNDIPDMQNVRDDMEECQKENLMNYQMGM
jgi:hypothetical protein